MTRKLYSTLLTEQQWHILEPLISLPKATGRPHTANIREIVNAQYPNPSFQLKSGATITAIPSAGHRGVYSP